MNLFGGLTYLLKVIFSFIFYLFVFIVLNICDMLFFAPRLLMKKITTVYLYTLMMNCILLYIISVYTFPRTSNHFMMTFDIIFFFSLLILILSHALKESSRLSPKICI